MKTILGIAVATLMVGVLFSGQSASAGPLEDGLTAAGRGDYASALSLLRPLAEKGNEAAQTQLGLMSGWEKRERNAGLDAALLS